MADIHFSNGVTIHFDGQPTQADIEEASQHALAVKPLNTSTQEQPAQPQEQGFGTDLINRGKSIWDTLTKKPETARDFATAPLEKPLRVFGDIAGAANDVIGAGMKKAIDFVGDKISNNKSVQNIASTDATGKGLDATAGASKVLGDVYNHLATKYPNVAKDVESAFNIASFIPAGEGARIAGTEAKAVANDLGTLIAKGTQESIPKEIQSAVQSGIEKGIRPSVSGKATTGAMDKYFSRASDAVSAIISHKDNLKLIDNIGEEIKGALPKTLDQFSQAVGQTKKAIFEQYNSMAKGAGEAGAKVDLNQVVGELKKAISDPVLQDLDKSAVSYAQKIADSLEKRGSYTAEQAQGAIGALNKKLESFYKGQSGGSTTKTAIDAMIANHLRENLDGIIANLKGEGYQKLKNMYGSLKTIEKDVSHRALIDARKNNKGLIDFTDIFTYGDIARGVLTGNPADIAKGAFGKGAQLWYKMKNNPNNVVKNMFGDVEKLLQKGEKASKPFVPESATGKAIMKTKDLPAGMSIKAVSGENPLIQEAGMTAKEATGQLRDTVYGGLKKMVKDLERKANEPSSNISASQKLEKRLSISRGVLKSLEKGTEPMGAMQKLAEELKLRGFIK